MLVEPPNRESGPPSRRTFSVKSSLDAFTSSFGDRIVTEQESAKMRYRGTILRVLIHSRKRQDRHVRRGPARREESSSRYVPDDPYPGRSFTAGWQRPEVVRKVRREGPKRSVAGVTESLQAMLKTSAEAAPRRYLFL